MIDARELRRGNWVNYIGDALGIRGYNQIISIDDRIGLKGYEESIFKTLPLCSFDPIALTPGILEKCGEIYIQPFEWQFRVKVSAISILFRRNSGIWYSELGGIYLGDKIQYLHQLQNLFFSLCDKELEIKL